MRRCWLSALVPLAAGCIELAFDKANEHHDAFASSSWTGPIEDDDTTGADDQPTSGVQTLTGEDGSSSTGSGDTSTGPDRAEAEPVTVAWDGPKDVWVVISPMLAAHATTCALVRAKLDWR